jgi:hypothetical protein
MAYIITGHKTSLQIYATGMAIFRVPQEHIYNAS